MAKARSLKLQYRGHMVWRSAG